MYLVICSQEELTAFYQQIRSIALKRFDPLSVHGRALALSEVCRNDGSCCWVVVEYEVKQAVNLIRALEEPDEKTWGQLLPLKHCLVTNDSQLAAIEYQALKRRAWV